MFRGLYPVHSFVEQREGRTTVFFPDFSEFLRMSNWLCEAQDRRVPCISQSVLPPSNYLTDEDFLE